MNDTLDPDPGSPCLAAIVELKWLLSGHGVGLHVERLQGDADYARRVLDLAAALPHSALRVAARRVRGCLHLDPPAAQR
ncbi:MAG: hypothetical protein KGI90_04610 [Burkholderiales bacterium]|nr:hypothetical protein [Burkholderiales bacterium]